MYNPFSKYQSFKVCRSFGNFPLQKLVRLQDRMEKYSPNLHPRQWFLRKKKYIMENLTKRIIFEYSEGTRPLKRGMIYRFHFESVTAKK